VKPRLTNSRTSFSPKLSDGRIRIDGSRGIEPRLLLLLPLLATPTIPVRNRNDDQEARPQGLQSDTTSKIHHKSAPKTNYSVSLNTNKTLKKQNNPNNFKVSGHKNGHAFNTLLIPAGVTGFFIDIKAF